MGRKLASGIRLRRAARCQILCLINRCKPKTAKRILRCQKGARQRIARGVYPCDSTLTCAAAPLAAARITDAGGDRWLPSSVAGGGPRYRA